MFYAWDSFKSEQWEYCIRELKKLFSNSERNIYGKSRECES